MENGIILGFDILLNPMKFLLSLFSFSHKQIYLKKLDALLFFKEIATLRSLAIEGEREIIFVESLHKYMLRAQIDGILVPIVDLGKLPPSDEVKSSLVEQDSGLFDLIKDEQLNSDDPSKLICTLWLLKEALINNKLNILEEKLEYVDLEHKDDDLLGAYADLVDTDIDYHPYLPRYQEQYRSRRFLL